ILRPCIEMVFQHFLIFGGVALVDAALMGDAPAEGFTAAAGPLHSFFLAWIAICCETWLGGTVWIELAKINLSLALFNLLPLYPLDGGRILRALILPIYGIRNAGRFTAKLTRWIAIIGIIPTLVLVIQGKIPWIIPVLLGMLFWAARDPHDFFYLQWRQGEKKQDKLKEGKTLPVKLEIANQETLIGEIGNDLESRSYHLILTANPEGKVTGWLDEGSLWKAMMGGDYHKNIGAISQHVAGVQSSVVEEEGNSIEGITRSDGTDNKQGIIGDRKEMHCESENHPPNIKKC
ncbi:MAG TPA: site-2 protease family protein, partial [Bacillota bacterium]|nr:site-2 protease family protein [Bacillota bacterium]